MRSLLSATALTALCFSATPMFADVTPEDVWRAYKEMMVQSGTTPTAEVERDGDTLVVRDMVYGMTIDFAGASFSDTTTVPEIRFQERPDGTVAMWFPAPLTSVFVEPVAEGLDYSLEGNVITTRSTTHLNGTSIVSGTPDNMLFTLADNSVELIDAPVILNDEMVHSGFTAKLSGIAGTYSIVRSYDPIKAHIDITIAAMSYEAEESTPESGDLVEMGFTTSDMTIKGQVTMLQGNEKDIMHTLVGMSDVDVNLGFADSSTFVAVTSDEPNSGMDIKATSGQSTLGLTLKGGAIGYDATAGDVNITVGGPQIPGGQVEVAMKEYSTALLFPLAASDAPQPFEAKIGLEEVVLPEIAWMIADPSGQLPHDPASLRLAFEGTLENGVNLFDAEAIAALEASGDKMPFTLQTLELPEIFLSLAGASIAGEGTGKFLDKEPAVAGGMPPFAGNLSLKLVGVADLIGNLTATGILPAEQAMSAQMMLGLFARPGDVAGELVSEIEMTEDGQIIANGQPLPF
ncbi:DUF2125 domain-containing protein [Celeribacter halophilus]|uniref:DUF2125 domain-containing protein n=1 Tax=Celeribacter halophilus TaxID=576117 RepID=UPI001C07F3CF|nr:DUF2125 domain-containing protein [Celeribacter halophilus]MBU2890100.1 DUF2125 domain-containing protein [Celeribacter halophilus]MDO6511288.1 DUF2125 domain-containing protein [Celeribacter halophilus]